jgi:thioredoxin 1
MEVLMAKPVEVSDSTYQSEVIESSIPVLVDFWAPWCGPCRMVGPILEEIASEQDSRLKIAKVNVDEHQQHAGQLGVFNIPTMILYKDGQPVEKIVGALPKNQLLDRLSPYLTQEAGEADTVIAL